MPRIACTVAALGIIIGGTWARVPAQDVQPIQVYIDNHAGMQRLPLQEATQEADRIFQAAGVRIEWMQVAGPEVVPRSRLLRVLLLSTVMAVKKRAAEHTRNGVLAASNGVAGRIYIFYDRVAFVAVDHRVRLGSVLGRVIAHEIVHVLLPEEGHSITGIMRATIDWTIVAPPTFSLAEGGRLRTAVTR